MSEIKETFLARATAHARSAPHLAPVARFRNGVTDAEVGAVFYVMEAEGLSFTHTATGRWLPPAGRAGGVLQGVDTTAVIREMTRTGLVRMATDTTGRDFLIPARVHLADPDFPTLTACRDGVEGLKGRVRLIGDLALVDCLECESVVVKGSPRGL